MDVGSVKMNRLMLWWDICQQLFHVIAISASFCLMPMKQSTKLSFTGIYNVFYKRCPIIDGYLATCTSSCRRRRCRVHLPASPRAPLFLVLLPPIALSRTSVCVQNFLPADPMVSLNGSSSQYHPGLYRDGKE